MQIHEVSLAKKTVITEDRTYLLWESVGRTLVEAQLTAQQIQQVFQQAEQGSTDAGGNRTGLGQIKDAGTEVAKAWNDLKSKVQNSGPVRNVDALYDQAAEKLKQATGGDQGVMKYVEKYRTFAKEHPIAQSFIYAALIAAAGISGAGAGGAAALGLLKMTDKLLQGEKFSSAAYSGAKTGAVAYGAGQLGKAMQGGDQATSTVTSMPGGSAYDWISNDPRYMDWVDQVMNSSARSDAWKEEFMKQVDIWGGSLPGPEAAPGDISRTLLTAMKVADANTGLRENQINKAFYLAAGLQTQLNEGMWDSIKGAAGAVGKWAATKGHNLTTHVTADKLMSAWKSAGSPTDSEAVADVMRNAGVDEEIVQRVLAAVAKAPQLKQAPAKKHTGGKVAGQVSQTPNAIRQRQARAAKKAKPSTATKPSTAGANAFGQMASQLGGSNTAKTPTGVVHRATANNPNAAYAESYVRQIAESWEEYKVDEGLASGLGKLAGSVTGGVQKVGQAIASPFRNVASGYRSGKVDAKTSGIADKAYRAWSAYRQQLDKAAPGGKADPTTIEKQLLAFVQKNLLGQKQISTLINKNQILGVVKQLAGQPATATQPPAGKQPPATQAPAKTEPAKKGVRMGKAPAAKTPATKTPATKTPTTPAGKTAPGGAGAFGQMANQLGGTSGKTSTGGTATPTATGVKNTASATNPNQPVQSMADFTKQNPTAKYHEVTGEITPYGQQQAAVKAQTDKEQQAATVAKYKQQAADKAAAEAPPQKMQVAVRPDGSTTNVPEPVNAPATGATFDPTDKKAVAAFKKQMKGLKGTQGTVPSTPGGAQTKPAPITVGGEKIKPTDPRYAQIMKSNPPIQEAAAPAQELELFKKLVTLAAQAEQEVDPNAPAQAPTATAQTAQKKLTGKNVKSTGNPQADALLAQSGYKVQT